MLFELTETADPRFDRPIEAIVVLVLAFSPIALGAVQAWSELVVIVLAAIASLVLSAKLLIRRDIPFVWSWTYLPIVLLLSLTALQLIPLSPGVLELVSPNTARSRQSLLAESAAAQPAWPLSFYPEATLANLRMMAAIAALYVVTLNVIRQSEQVRRMLLAITLIGTAVALIALGHLAVGAERIYGSIGYAGSWTLAPFINRNHFGQFMNLSLGAAVALLLLLADQTLRSHRQSRERDTSIRLHAPRSMYVVAAGVALIGSCVFLSMSRGAMISLALSIVAAAIAARRRAMRRRLWILAPVALVVALIVITAATDRLAGRFADVADPQSHSTQGRIRILADVLRGWRSFPLLGTGMGSFETFYPQLDRSTWASLATHAENEYAQMLLEAGAMGLAAVLGFLVLMGIRYVRCARSESPEIALPAIGLGIGLLAVIIQSAVDFGQHVPANAALAAVSFALLAGGAQLAARSRPVENRAPAVSDRRRLLRAVSAGAVLVAATLLCHDAIRRAQAERAWADALITESVLRHRDWAGEDEEYARLLIAAMRAAQLRPGDIHYHHWLNFYRWKQLSRRRDPQSGQVVLLPRQIEWTQRVADELEQGVRRCPTFGPSYTLAGVLRDQVLQDPRGAELIRKGWMLSRNDPNANFEAALLDARESQWDDAMRKFRHASALDPQYLSPSVVALGRDLNRADLAIELAGGDVPSLRRLVAALDRAHREGGARLAEKRLREAIRAAAEAADAPASAIREAGRLAMREQDYAAAVEFFRNVVNREPASADARLELARALAAGGNPAEAIEQARIAQRLGSESAGEFIVELRLRPSTTTIQPD